MKRSIFSRNWSVKTGRSPAGGIWSEVGPTSPPCESVPSGRRDLFMRTLLFLAAAARRLLDLAQCEVILGPFPRFPLSAIAPTVCDQETPWRFVALTASASQP